MDEPILALSLDSNSFYEIVKYQIFPKFIILLTVLSTGERTDLSQLIGLDVRFSLNGHILLSSRALYKNMLRILLYGKKQSQLLQIISGFITFKSTWIYYANRVSNIQLAKIKYLWKLSIESF